MGRKNQVTVFAVATAVVGKDMVFTMVDTSRTTMGVEAKVADFQVPKRTTSKRAIWTRLVRPSKSMICNRNNHGQNEAVIGVVLFIFFLNHNRDHILRMEKLFWVLLF